MDGPTYCQNVTINKTREAFSLLLPLHRNRQRSLPHSAKHFPIHPLCVCFKYFSKHRAMPTCQESMEKTPFPSLTQHDPIKQPQKILIWAAKSDLPDQFLNPFGENGLILLFSISVWEKNHCQHNSPLNGPCLTRTSAAGSRGSENPGESPARLTCSAGSPHFYPERHLRHLPVLAFRDLWRCWF